MKRILTCLFLFFSIVSQASHFVGSEWTYKCISPGVFEVHLFYYRDCNGIPLCSPETCGGACSMSVFVKGADASCNGTDFTSTVGGTMTLVGPPKSVTPDSGPNPNTCSNMGCIPVGQRGSYNPSVERYEFVGTFNLGLLPAGCCKVSVSAYQCCRNASIKTINTPSSNGFYSEVIINRCLSSAPLNSSPVYKNPAKVLICNGQPYVYNLGATDPDGDSLSYEFTPALALVNTPVTYIAPFTYDKPMPWSGNAASPFPGGIRCDPLTGDVMFTPAGATTIPFSGIISVMVKQWRLNSASGVYELMGYSARELQVTLDDCPSNHPPTFKTNPPDGLLPAKYSWEVCAGTQLCFDVIAKDTDFNPPTIADSTYLTWDSALYASGATFTPNYSTRTIREDSYKFCWTPDESYSRSRPYYFTIKGVDNVPTIHGVVLRAFSVKVYGANVTIQKTDMKCGKWQWQYVKNNPTQVISGNTWRIAKNPADFSFALGSDSFNNTQTTPVLSFTKPGKYLVQLTVNVPGPNSGTCTKLFYDTVMVDTIVTASVRDTFTCKGRPVTLTAKVKFGKSPYQYRWFNNILDTLTPLNIPTLSVPDFTANPLLSRKYTVQVIDSSGCRAWDSLPVIVRLLPVGINIDSARICAGDTLRLTCLDPAFYTRKWSNGDTTESIYALTSGIYTLEVKDTTYGCALKDTAKVFVNPIPVVIRSHDTTICKGISIQLKGSGANEYSWLNVNTNTALGNTAVITVTPSVTTRYRLIGSVTTAGVTCSSRDTVTITVLPAPTAGFTTHSAVICGGASIQLVAPDTNVANSYTWSTGDTSKFIKVTSTGTYKLKLKNKTSGCEVNDSVNVFANPQPHVVAINDTTVCSGSIVQLKATGAVDYKWYKTNTGDTVGTTSAINVSPTVATQYAVLGSVTTNGLTCSGKDTVNIIVNPVPNGFISHAIRFICSGESVSLSPADSNANTQFTWSTGDTVKSINAGTAGIYKLTLKNRITGCSLKDSVNVGVNPLPPVVASKDTILCSSSTIQLKATGAVNYKWYRITAGDTIGTTANINITPAVTTQYGVSGSVTLNGITCKNKDTVNVTVSIITFAKPTSTQGACLLDSIYTLVPMKIVTANGGRGLWYNRYYNVMLDSAAGIASLNLLPYKPTAPSFETDYNFHYTYRDSNNCTKTDSVYFFLRDVEQPNAGSDKVFCHTDSAVNLAAVQRPTPQFGPWTGPTVYINNGFYYFDPATAFRYPDVNRLSYEYYRPFAGGATCKRYDTVLYWVYPPPTPLIVGDSVASSLSVKTYSVISHPGATYTWTVTGGTQTAGGNTNTIDVQWGTGISGQLSVKENIITGCQGDSATLHISLNGVGINEVAREYYSLYPNPTDGWITLRSSALLQNEQLVVTDLVGKELPVLIQKTENGFRLNLGEYPSGVYLISVTNDQYSANFKVIKQ